ncbi:hypothetical protein [Vibrio albus]|nr:hypothetical protein [Vibrio albus]
MTNLLHYLSAVPLYRRILQIFPSDTSGRAVLLHREVTVRLVIFYIGRIG